MSGYYLQCRSMGRNAPFFVGPFAFKGLAWQAVSEAVDRGANLVVLFQSPDNPQGCYVVIDALSHTAARAVGMVDDPGNPRYNLMSRMPQRG